MSAAATHAAPAAVASASAGRAGRARAAAKVRLATRVSPRTPLFFAASLDRRFLISGARSGGARRARPGAGARGARRPRRAPTAISRTRGWSRPRVTRRRDEGRADAPRPSAVAPERRAGPSPSLQDRLTNTASPLDPSPLPSQATRAPRAAVVPAALSEPSQAMVRPAPSPRRPPRGRPRRAPRAASPRRIFVFFPRAETRRGPTVASRTGSSPEKIAKDFRRFRLRPPTIQPTSPPPSSRLVPSPSLGD